MAHSAAYISKHLALIKQYWLQLGLVDEHLLEGVEHASAKNSPNIQIQACHHLLWGLFLYNDGDMVRGHDYLVQAEQLLQGTIVSRCQTIVKNDLYAYALCEISVFYYRFFDMKHIWDYLRRARSFALSKPVQEVINTAELSFRHNRFFMDVIPGDMSELDASLDYLRKKGIDYWLIVGLYYRMAFNVSMDLLDQTLDNYLEGSALCRKLDLDTYQSALHMALGIWYANHKEWQKALKCYTEAYSMTESPYRQALCLENTASLYERYPNHEKRMEMLKKMLSHCEKHNITQKIPIICQYFAKYYLEQVKDLSMARFYYKKGYDAAIEMQDQGIHLFSRLAIIVREYPEFMEKYYHYQTGSASDESVSDSLKFCLDQDWRSIKYKFQQHLLLYLREQEEDGHAILKRLNLKLSTLQAIRRKLVDAGYEVPDLRYGYAREKKIELEPTLSRYVKNLNGMDWKSANLRFQADVMRLLYQHNAANKLKMSKQLKISYNTMVTLLKSIPEGC
ncbi:MAG: hypothetical protein U1B83_08380 [Candidatus Cloacimonadaceae bacterium]|nr:hypothetical protein [Candidatus Cloacimonadaceae bacterium]